MAEMVATRQAYGDALLELGEKNKDIVLAAKRAVGRKKR